MAGENKTGLPDRQEMEALLKHMQGSIEILEEQMKPLAAMLFTKYQTLQKAGFTEQQAFQIILTKGIEW